MLISSSCQDSKVTKPKNLPSHKTMVNILYDIHYAEAVAQFHPNDGIRNTRNLSLSQRKNLISDSLYAGILHKYDLNDSLLSMSLLYYSSQLKEYEKIYEEVIDRIQNDLNNRVYQDSIALLQKNLKKQEADSIANALKKQEQDSIAEAIRHHLIDSIATKTNRSFEFVADSIAMAEEVQLKHLADSIADAKRKHIVDSIVKATGANAKTTEDSLIKLELATQKHTADSLALDSLKKAPAQAPERILKKKS